MIRPARTGFAWERDTSAPFIHISWDYRRGPTISWMGTPTGRRLAVAITVAAWAVIIALAATLRGCGSFA
jgi:hypothetical protein